MISQEELNQKVREFISKKSETLSCPTDFHFENEVIRFNMETKDDQVFEATFCEGYQHSQYLLALSAQVGCPVRCKFCQLGNGGFKRNLSAEEILDQIRIILAIAYKRNYPIFNKPLKLTFVMGGDALTNKEFPEALRRIKEEIPLKIKISTIFPKTEVGKNIFKKIVEIAKEYPNIFQFQISLNSTDEKYRQSLTSIPLADFNEIREAAELWFREVPNPRKINLTFTLNQETPLDPEAIKLLPPELFAIRFRPWVPTKAGQDNGLQEIMDQKFEDAKRKFKEAGYMYISGEAGHVEEHFRLAPGEFLEQYLKLKKVSGRIKMELNHIQTEKIEVVAK